MATYYGRKYKQLELKHRFKGIISLYAYCKCRLPFREHHHLIYPAQASLPLPVSPL